MTDHLFAKAAQDEGWMDLGWTTEGCAMDEHGEYDPVTGEYLRRRGMNVDVILGTLAGLLLLGWIIWPTVQRWRRRQW